MISKMDLSSLQKEQKLVYREINRLRSIRGRENCLKMAAQCEDGLFINGHEFDSNPWLLGCRNAVIDLRIGEARPGRPADLIFKASPVEWPDEGIEALASAWEKFLTEIFRNDPTLISYVARLLGYSITGHANENVISIFNGSGRNGKSTLLELIKFVIGPVAVTLPSELLLDSKFSRNSGSPSPDILALKGARIAIMSETDEGRRFSASRAKWLSGSDTLTGRAPYDKDNVEFSPTHHLILSTNELPHASAADFAFWERVQVVHFPLAFVNRDPQDNHERRADKNLASKLKKEAPGILAWLVRGCLEWQRIGLDPPKSVTEATAKYQRGEDVLADFIEQNCYVDERAEVPATQIYDEFRKWYEDNVSKKYKISQKKFGTLLSKKFKKSVNRRPIVYHGIGLIDSKY